MLPNDLPKNLPTLETPRLILRKLRMEDAEDMFEYAQDRELGLNGLWLPYTQLQESIDDIAEALEAYEKGNFWDWAIEHRAEGKMIGLLFGAAFVLLGLQQFVAPRRSAETASA